MSQAGPTRSAEELARALGLDVDVALVEHALAHRSYVAESPGRASNERLEFLGDAVLGLVVTDHLYRSLPDLPEGDLARMRAAIVSADALAPIAAGLGLGEALLLGRGEERSGGRQKPSLLADALEALIGAIYCAAGLEGARRFVLAHFAGTLEEETTRDVLGDAKNALQERAAQLGLPAPSYQLSERGPDHAKSFEAEVRVGPALGRGSGGSKKQAERAAAVEALEQLAVLPTRDDAGAA